MRDSPRGDVPSVPSEGQVSPRIAGGSGKAQTVDGTVKDARVIDMTDLVPRQSGKARTAKATATLLRRTDEKLAERLRSHGWLVIPPEERQAPSAT